MAVTIFKALRGLPSRQALQFGARAFAVVLMHQLHQQLTDEFVLLPSQEFFPGRIGGLDHAIKTRYQDQVS